MLFWCALPAPYSFAIGKRHTENGTNQMVSACWLFRSTSQEVPVAASGFEETGVDPLRFLLD
jgi:hypothetical protein